MADPGSSEVTALDAGIDSAIGTQGLLDTVAVLATTPSPAGHERPLARELASWAARRWPACAWAVHPVGTASANLVGTSSAGGTAPELLLYSHLDTSLTGETAWDVALTGCADAAPALSIDRAAGTVAGFGLGVAKAPAAAALLGFAAGADVLRSAGIPHRHSILLAAGGTHRAAPPGWAAGQAPASGAGSGVRHHLGTGPRPSAVIVAKCGPPGVLYEEPGAMYLQATVHAGFSPVLARATAQPTGGLIAHTGTIVGAIENWRSQHLKARQATYGQVAAEAGIGAISAGLPYKADLFPGVLTVQVYVVTVPDDHPESIAAELRSRMRETLAGSPIADCAVEVVPYAVNPAASTPVTSPVVRSAIDAWTAVAGPPQPIESWTGSTDGVIFRAAGIDTVRLGPTPSTGADPRVDVMRITDLVRFARIYGRLAVRHALGLAQGRARPAALGRPRHG